MNQTKRHFLENLDNREFVGKTKLNDFSIVPSTTSLKLFTEMLNSGMTLVVMGKENEDWKPPKIETRAYIETFRLSGLLSTELQWQTFNGASCHMLDSLEKSLDKKNQTCFYRWKGICKWRWVTFGNIFRNLRTIRTLNGRSKYLIFQPDPPLKVKNFWMRDWWAKSSL